MPRQPRIEFEGAYYHVLARGDRREPIVVDDADREMFVRTLGEACTKSGWRIHAWVLMGNHYHLLLETPHANLVSGMKWLQNTFTRRFNTRHRKWGHLFGGRYKAVVTEGRSGDYFSDLMDYIHLNPTRARLVDPKNGLGLLVYRWSSLASAYAVPPKQRPSWMEVSQGLAAAGSADTAKGRKQYVSELEELARQGSGIGDVAGQGLQSTLRRGWYWGSQEFREKLLGLLKSKGSPIKNRNYRTSPIGKSRRGSEAGIILRRGMEHFGVTEKHLSTTKGSDPAKVAIAWMLHTRTTLPQKWIADKLHMRSAANVSQLVRRTTKSQIKEWEHILSEFVD